MSRPIVLRELTKFPCGRTPIDGVYSGETFRKEQLLMALRSPGNVTVDLKGTVALPSSWLEEAFGGLVREEKYTAHELNSRLILQTASPLISKQIWRYIASAEGTPDVPDD